MKRHSSGKSAGASGGGGHSGGGGGGGGGRALDDAESDLLELKRAELKKELELQIKMDSARGLGGSAKSSGGGRPVAGGSATQSAAAAAALLRRRKRAAATRSTSSSSSGSSSSGSDSSSGSGSSSSSRGRRGGGGGGGGGRKNAKTKRNQRSSSSSEEDPRERQRKAAALAHAHNKRMMASGGSGSATKLKPTTTSSSAAHLSKLQHHQHQHQHSHHHPNPPHQYSGTAAGKRSPSPSQIIVRKHTRPISPSPSKSHSASGHHHHHQSRSSAAAGKSSVAAATSSGRSHVAIPAAYMEAHVQQQKKAHRQRVVSPELLHQQQLQLQQSHQSGSSSGHHHHHHHHHHQQQLQQQQPGTPSGGSHHGSHSHHHRHATSRERLERAVDHRQRSRSPQQQAHQLQHQHQQHLSRSRSSRSPLPPMLGHSSASGKRSSRSREMRSARSPQSATGSSSKMAAARGSAMPSAYAPRETRRERSPSDVGRGGGASHQVAKSRDGSQRHGVAGASQHASPAAMMFAGRSSGGHHEGSRERERERERELRERELRDRERRAGGGGGGGDHRDRAADSGGGSLAARERERAEMHRMLELQQQQQRGGRERERFVDRDGKAVVERGRGERDIADERGGLAGKGAVEVGSRLLPRPADRALAMAMAARDGHSREGSADDGRGHQHRRSRSLSRGGGGRSDRAPAAYREYADRERERERDRYAEAGGPDAAEQPRYAMVQHHRGHRGDGADRQSSPPREMLAAEGRRRRDERDIDREREYLVVRMRTREDSRGRLIEEIDPYAPREIRSMSDRDRRSLEREHREVYDGAVRMVERVVADPVAADERRYEEGGDGGRRSLEKRRLGAGRGGGGHERGGGAHERESDYATPIASSSRYHDDRGDRVDDQRDHGSSRHHVSGGGGGQPHHQPHHSATGRHADRPPAGQNAADWHPSSAGVGSSAVSAEHSIRGDRHSGGGGGNLFAGTSEHRGSRDRGAAQDWDRSGGGGGQELHTTRHDQHRGADDKWSRSGAGSAAGHHAAGIGRDGRPSSSLGWDRDADRGASGTVGPSGGHLSVERPDRSGMLRDSGNTPAGRRSSADRSDRWQAQSHGGGRGGGDGGGTWDDGGDYQYQQQQQQRGNHPTDKMHPMRDMVGGGGVGTPSDAVMTPFSRDRGTPGTPLTSGGGGGAGGGAQVTPVGGRRWPNWRSSGGASGGGGVAGSSGGVGGRRIPQGPVSGGGTPHQMGAGATGGNQLMQQQQLQQQPIAGSFQQFRQHGADDHGGDQQRNDFRNKNVAEQQQGGADFAGHSPFSHVSVRSLLSMSAVKPPKLDDHPSAAVAGIPTLASVAPIIHPKVASAEKVAKPGDAAGGRAAKAERDEDNLSEISDDDDILNRQEEAASAAAAAAALAAAATGMSGMSGVGVGGGGVGPFQSPPVVVGGHKPALLPTPAFKVGELPRYIVPNLLQHAHHHHHNSATSHHQLQQQQQQQHMQQHQSLPALHSRQSGGGHFGGHHSSPALPISGLASIAHPNNRLGAGGHLTDSASDGAPKQSQTPGGGGLLPDDLELDFEEISDGELEEEARIRSLGDALGVDWASLVDESKAIARDRRPAAGASAKQRWQSHRILLDVGVSFRRAGAQFASSVLNAAHRQVQQEERAAVEAVEQAKLAVKREAETSAADGLIQVKREIVEEQPQQQADETAEAQQTAAAESTEPTDADQEMAAAAADTKDEPQPELLFHPIACVQVASRASAEARKTLVLNVTGAFSRALGTERDIAMRRRLCGLDAEPCYGLGERRVGTEAVSGCAALAKELFEAAMSKITAY